MEMIIRQKRLLLKDNMHCQKFKRLRKPKEEKKGSLCPDEELSITTWLYGNKTLNNHNFST